MKLEEPQLYCYIFVMCNNEACLGYFLLAVICGFGLLIFLGLKYNSIFLAKNLLITTDSIWSSLQNRPYISVFSNADLLFGVWQEHPTKSTSAVLTIKDHLENSVGHVEFPIGKRFFVITLGNESYTVEFPMTWSRTAILKSNSTGTKMASYAAISMFGKHKFEIPDLGTLQSNFPSLNFQVGYTYFLRGEFFGIAENVSKTRRIGRYCLFPSRLSLAVRIFMMVL